MVKKEINKKVIIGSLIGFIFVALGILVNWMFMIGAAIMMILNQKELMKQ